MKSSKVKSLISDRINLFKIFTFFIYRLNEVKVRVSPTKIVCKALIKRNSAKTKANIWCKALFSEVVYVNKEYYSESESTLKTDMISFYDSSQNLISYNNVKCNNNIIENVLKYILLLHGGPLNALKKDIKKFPFLGITPKEIIEKFEFKYTGFEKIDDRDTFSIRFLQNLKNGETLYKGFIYLDSYKLAVLKIKYLFIPYKREWAYSNIFKNIIKSEKVYIDYSKSCVSYSELNKRWYLSKIENYLFFTLKNSITNTETEIKIESNIQLTPDML